MPDEQDRFKQLFSRQKTDQSTPETQSLEHDDDLEEPTTRKRSSTGRWRRSPPSSTDSDAPPSDEPTNPEDRQRSDVPVEAADEEKESAQKRTADNPEPHAPASRSEPARDGPERDEPSREPEHAVSQSVTPPPLNGPADARSSAGETRPNPEATVTPVEERPPIRTATPVASAPPPQTPIAQSQPRDQTSQPSTSSPAYSGVSIRVGGCGQCGSQIASTFVDPWKPDYVPARRRSLYPVDAIAFDTDEAIRTTLPNGWRWQKEENIFVTPMPSPEYLAARLVGTEQSGGDRMGALVSGRGFGGVGGHPFLGRIAAENTLLANDESGDTRQQFVFRETIERQLQLENFRSGILLVCNSLTGGTGTGFSPVIPQFLRERMQFHPDLALDLSVLPSDAEIGERNYPKSILGSLHALLTRQLDTGGLVDTVVIADNDALANLASGSRRNFQAYNEILRDMVMPLLLAPTGIYNVTELSSVLDSADIKRWIKTNAGFGPPEVSTIGYAKMPMSEFSVGRFMRGKNRRIKVREAFREMAAKAVRQCALGGKGHPRPEVGAVGVLFGPPEFFDRSLDMEGDLLDFLMNELREQFETSRFRKPDCLRFSSPGFDYVGLSVLVSGISSTKLEEIFKRAMGPRTFLEKWKTGQTVTENIRELDDDYIEDLMVKEIREALGFAG